VEEWWQRRQRVTGTAVPYEVGRYRDAWSPYRALVEQFRPERNAELVLSQIPPAADVYLVWVCGIGHEFVATPAEQRGRPGRARASRSWCPVCATPSLLPSAPRWPRLHNSGVAVGDGGDRMPARRVAAPGSPPAPELRSREEPGGSVDDVTPGTAFRSERASRATSAAEGRLRALLSERLEVDLSLTAVRTRTPFFGRLEVWPDIVIAELGIAIELDTIGRNADEHVGRREVADRRKDRLLAEVGWSVIRMRCRPLRSLGPDDLEVAGVSQTAVDALIERMVETRGALLVQAYARR
jgi:very-short-patch-repair endonuclease